MDLLDGLSSIASREVVSAVDELEAVRGAQGKAQALPALDAAAATEQKIAELLEKLLSDPQAFARERSAEPPKTRQADQEEALHENRQRAERMLAAVKEFIQEQEDVVKMSKQIKDTPVDDFSKGDEETLKKVTDAELKWAKYFQELATDLSKLPPQDFSLATQAQELDEIYTDVRKAADAVSQKTIEMAVPLEQSGLELAKSFETNIEKWLAESPDRIAWKMEDPVQDYDVPLAELPKELEDLIGDLLEQEKDLLDDAADATSAWLDNMDKGIGWGAADGPIADMSAKGVTGNVLPDSQEVGGRSGEGRTGKSSGQYVQDTARGKGGRNTPTRLTLDPYEAGSVKDTSAEPPTGATGGGKASGVGQEGLRGPMPPTVRGELKRVAQLQQQLIDKAQNLDYGLRKYNYPRGELPKTIELMKQIQTNIEQGDIPTAGSEFPRRALEPQRRSRTSSRGRSGSRATTRPRCRRKSATRSPPGRTKACRRNIATWSAATSARFPKRVPRNEDQGWNRGVDSPRPVRGGRGRGPGRRNEGPRQPAARAGRRQVPQPGFLRRDADEGAEREPRQERQLRGRALVADRLGPVR